MVAQPPSSPILESILHRIRTNPTSVILAIAISGWVFKKLLGKASQHDELYPINDSSDVDVSYWKSQIAILKSENAQLRASHGTAQKARLLAERYVGVLGDEVYVLKQANRKLQGDMKQYTIPLYKLRRRALLDQARNKVAAAWAPRGQWSEISNRTPENIKDLIVRNHIFRRRLDDQAIAMICDVHSPVRLEGNKVAHEAAQNLLRDAILFGEPGPDTEVLKNIFTCVFDSEWRS